MTVVGLGGPRRMDGPAPEVAAMAAFEKPLWRPESYTFDTITVPRLDAIFIGFLSRVSGLV